MSGTIQLFSVFHKPFYRPAASFVTPIQVGAAIAAQRLEMQGDNTGDHISSHNTFYNELTACYWIWKNADRTAFDAWGLCHYRRYFQVNKRKLFFIKRTRVYYTPTPESIDSVVNDRLYQRMQQLLQQHDVIVQRPEYAHKKKGKVYSIAESYAKQHLQEDWEHTMTVIKEKYPDYHNSIDAFNRQTKLSYYNMMVAPWHIWDGYFTWLFDILFEVENRLQDIAARDAYQRRVMGFLSERLLNLYLFHHKLKTGFLTIALFEK